MSADLEKSKLWKRSVALAKEVDEVLQSGFPYSEQYTIADPLHRIAITLTSDIAFVIGKGSETKDNAYDYRTARGHLFTIKSLLLISKEYDYVKDINKLLVDIELIRRELDEKIEKLDASENGAEK